MAFKNLTKKDIPLLKVQNWSICDYLTTIAKIAQEKLQLSSQPNNTTSPVLNVFNDDEANASLPIPLQSSSSNSKKRKNDDSINNNIPKKSSTSSSNVEQKKKNRKTSIITCKKTDVTDGPSTPPPMPEEFINAIRNFSQGRNLSEEFKLVIQKGLYSTDLSPNHNRFSIPVNKIKMADFLNEDEERNLRSRDLERNNKMKFMEVKVIDPCLKLRTLNLSMWEMTSSFTYVLKGKWLDVVKDCELEPKMVLQLWAFRVDGELGFALVKLPKEEEN